MKIVKLALLSLVAIACGKESSNTSNATPASTASATGNITGAGSSFAYPLYSKWASMYADQIGVKVNYQSIGSSGGIRQLSDGVVDFGATDGPMTDEQTAKAKGGQVLHIPTALGGVSITYNIPSLTQPLKLSGEILGDIFLGGVTKWNDARIAALNPGVALPNLDILVVHRADGSGTTFILSDYLTSVSSRWQAKVGKGQTLNWPVGLGGKGSEGVAGQVKQTPGTIGYVELSYAKHNNLPSAEIRNAEGTWVAPSLESVTAAAAGVSAGLPANSDYRISIVNAPGKNAYPISSFTWMLVYKTQSDSVKGKQLVDFITWGLTEGQAQAAALDYAPLPAEMVSRLKTDLAKIEFGQQK